MTPKSLFNIILNIVALFFIIDLIEVVAQLISTITFMFNPDPLDANGDFFVLLGTTLILAFYLFITYQLLFNTNRILNKLKLDRGFSQEEFSFNISEASILSIALIVIAGVILINEVPSLCNSLYQYIQQRIIQNHTGVAPSLSYIIIHIVKIILALLILGERRRIVSFAGSKEKTGMDA